LQTATLGDKSTFILIFYLYFIRQAISIASCHGDRTSKRRLLAALLPTVPNFMTGELQNYDKIQADTLFQAHLHNQISKYRARLFG
jgi:hypothetical protein